MLISVPFIDVSLKLSRRYDSCFLKWYSESKNVKRPFATCLVDTLEYLRGDASTDECSPLFKQYQSCLTVGLRSIMCP